MTEEEIQEAADKNIMSKATMRRERTRSFSGSRRSTSNRTFSGMPDRRSTSDRLGMQTVGSSVRHSDAASAIREETTANLQQLSLQDEEGEKCAKSCGAVKMLVRVGSRGRHSAKSVDSHGESDGGETSNGMTSSGGVAQPDASGAGVGDGEGSNSSRFRSIFPRLGSMRRQGSRGRQAPNVRIMDSEGPRSGGIEMGATHVGTVTLVLAEEEPHPLGTKGPTHSVPQPASLE